MPARVKQIGKKFRVVEGRSSKIVTNAQGTPVDGGGHSSRNKAMAQARAINLSQRETK